MAHAKKPDFVLPRNGRVHSNRWGRQFSRLLAAEVCASALVMLDIPRSEVAWECWLPTPFASFPFTFPPVRHRVPPGSERALPAGCVCKQHSKPLCTEDKRPVGRSESGVKAYTVYLQYGVVHHVFIAVHSLGWCVTVLTFSCLMTYIYIYLYIYIYIYMSYRTASLQMLHFIYLFNKCTYWIF